MQFASEQQMPHIPWDLAAILLVLAIAVPWRGAIRVRALLAREDLGSSERIAIYASTIAFQWAITGVTAWRCVARDWHFDSLGMTLPNPRMAIAVGVALASLLGLVQLAAFRQLGRIPAEQRGRLAAIAVKLMPRTLAEGIPFTGLVLTVSICEEFLYRGFVFSLVQRVFHGSTLAALVGSSLLFGIGHYYQGRRGVINTSFLGALFAGMRVWTGSLAPAMIGHFAVDLLAGLGGSRWAMAAATGRDVETKEVGSEGPDS